MEIGLGVLLPIMLTVIILIGPLPKALEDKDLNELLVDFIIIAMFWVSYFLISQVDLNGLLNRIMG